MTGIIAPSKEEMFNAAPALNLLLLSMRSGRAARIPRLRKATGIRRNGRPVKKKRKPLTPEIRKTTLRDLWSLGKKI